MRIRVLVSLMALAASAPFASAAVPSPTVTGPVTGGNGTPFLASTSFDLAPLGYMEEEFFLSGTASGYTSAAPLGADGRWDATPAGSADYRTRIVVRRPVRRQRFNGTVVVEWHNVSGGLDAAPDWTYFHTELMRNGYAWVGVSAQSVGVEGGSNPLGLRLWLKAVDPARYGSLVHPGDSFSYDMFSQVAQAIRRPAGLRPLGDLKAKRVIAVGESQSAFRLVTYVNAVHPVAQVYDGFLVHSRGSGAPPLSQAPQEVINAPSPATIRTDIDVPVLTVQTESDLIGLNSLPARQPDTRRIRLWEIAGTAHADTYQLGVGAADIGPAAADTTHLPLTSTAFGVINCGKPLNAGPAHYVMNTAIARLNRWVRRGTPPPPAPRLEVTPGPPAAIARDQPGNARGGIRTPQVDVPIHTLSGEGQTGSGFCFLFGTTTPFDAATLQALYPTHDTYVSAILKATRAAIKAGFLLKADAPAIKTAAQNSTVGN